jgi:DNA-binding NtrC family response regulator
LHIPPLRERRGEIPVLAEGFLRQICQELGRPEPRLSAEVMAALSENDWPGNVRELKNVIERAVLLCAGPEVGLDHLPAKRRAPSIRSAVLNDHTGSAYGERQPAPADEPPRERTPPPSDERQRILDALASCAGNQSRAAKLLDMPRRTFVAKLDRYRIPRPNKG